jgi:4-carboxymuconolactone decarboxylase
MAEDRPVISDDVLAKIAAREADVLREPPRIPPMREDEFTDELRQVTAELKIAANLPPGPYVPEVVSTGLKHHKLYMANLAYAIQLMSGTLAPRLRELAILRVAWLCMAPFEWAEHVAASYRMTDLTAFEIDRVVAGADAEGWTLEEAAILRGVEELHADAMITDATWAELETFLDEKLLIEFCMLVGQYTTTAYLQNSTRARLMPDSLGLRAR